MRLPRHRHVRRSMVALAWLGAVGIGGCGNADFAAVKAYKVFLEDAKPSLQKMNSVREQLFLVESPEEMLGKFRDELLPEVDRLAKLAKDHPDPEVKKLKTIHSTLRSVMQRYSEATARLVEELEKATKDEEREKALVTWGEADGKFGSDMAALVEELEQYLDKLRKG